MNPSPQSPDPTWGLVREREARKRAVAAEKEQVRLRQQAQADGQKARTEAVKSRQVAQFFEDMLASAGPAVAKGRDATILKSAWPGAVFRPCRDSNHVRAETQR